MAAVLSEPAVSRYQPSHIAGDPSRLSAQQRELIERAATLGREKFAARAERHDREASFPIDNFRDLPIDATQAKNGLLGPNTPRPYFYPREGGSHPGHPGGGGVRGAWR